MTYVNVALVVLAAIFLQGCKVQVIAHKGGDVTTASGQMFCFHNGDGWTPSECVSEAKDTTYQETFIPKPAPGYKFIGWSRGDGHLCGGKKEACSLSAESFEGYPSLIAILESDETFYLRPMFARRHDDKTNPLAKYNGVWEFSLASGGLHCDGRVPTPSQFDGLKWRWRLNVEPDGTVGFIFGEYEGSRWWESSYGSAYLTFDNWRNGGEFSSYGYSVSGSPLRFHSRTDNFFNMFFEKGNSKSMTGEFGLELPYRDCPYAYIPASARRIGN